MQFLKTVFWVIVAVVLVLFARTNWSMVSINLWGGLQAGIKVPVVLDVAFLLGFLPTYIVYRTRLWTLQRRFEGAGIAHVANSPGPIGGHAPAPSEGEPRSNA